MIIFFAKFSRPYIYSRPYVYSLANVYSGVLSKNFLFNHDFQAAQSFLPDFTKLAHSTTHGSYINALLCLKNAGAQISLFFTSSE